MPHETASSPFEKGAALPYSGSFYLMSGAHLCLFPRVSGSLQKRLSVDFCSRPLLTLSHVAAPWRALRALRLISRVSQELILGSSPGLCLVNDLLT